jgi:hypothetical protein
MLTFPDIEHEVRLQMVDQPFQLGVSVNDFMGAISAQRIGRLAPPVDADHMGTRSVDSTVREITSFG